MSLRKNTKRKTLKVKAAKEYVRILVPARKGKKAGTLDEYMEFLTATNAFANHRRKPFQKISGRCFKL